MSSKLIYGLKPSILFQSAVHLLRRDIPSAKSVAVGTLKEFPAVSQLLTGDDCEDVDNTVLTWLKGDNIYVPKRLDYLFERAFLQMHLPSPESLTFLTFLEQADIHSHNGYLSDAPNEEFDATMKKFNTYLLTSLENWDDVPEEHRLSYEILIWLVREKEKMEAFRINRYAVDQLDGFHTAYILLMTDMAPLKNLQHVDLYISRLKASTKKFAMYAERLVTQRKAGVFPPKCCLEKVCRSIEGTITNLENESENMLISVLKEKFKTSTGQDLQEDLQLKASKAISEFVIPGYTSLLEEVKNCIGVADDHAGVWKLPNGEAFYNQCLRMETTTNLTAQQVHDIGLREVGALHAGVQEVIERLNKAGDMLLDSRDSIKSNLQKLNKTEKFFYSDSKEDRSSCIKDFQAQLAEISNKVDPMFSVLPQSKCEIKPMPAAMGEGGAGACYWPGSLDLTRPGYFYANLTDMKAQNKAQMRTLTAHEAVPGHHFQISVQLENTQLPYFRRACVDLEGIWFNAYVEGWGLYSERLAKEVGFYATEADGSEGYDLLGHYCAELLRACRLVVDTGMHAFKWDREKAVQYMADNTDMTRSECENEVDRYCVLPAQACSYKIGQLKLLELREKCRERDDFDIRQFHDKVLSIGAVPLETLEQILLNN